MSRYHEERLRRATEALSILTVESELSSAELGVRVDDWRAACAVMLSEDSYGAVERLAKSLAIVRNRRENERDAGLHL